MPWGVSFSPPTQKSKRWWLHREEEKRELLLNHCVRESCVRHHALLFKQRLKRQWECMERLYEGLWYRLKEIQESCCENFTERMFHHPLSLFESLNWTAPKRDLLSFSLLCHHLILCWNVCFFVCHRKVSCVSVSLFASPLSWLTWQET